MGESGTLLQRERFGAVEVLTLDRPEVRNALSPALLAELTAAFGEVDADDAVRVIVLTGAGDRAFCAGMDLKSFTEHGPDRVIGAPTDESTAEAEAVAPWQTAKPMIAAVNGAAVAGGFELMMACDLVVAAEHATFGLPEVKRGLIPGGGGTLLAGRIPLAVALELELTGDPIDASRALALGLVNRVVPADRVLETALELAARIAANGPLAVATTKRLVRRAVNLGGEQAWASRELLRQVFASEDAREGARAFVEKRAPNWTGR